MKHSTIAQNRRAFFDHFVEEEIEAGIVLTGSEVKSLRAGKANIVDAHATIDDGEMYILNMYIAEYTGANRFNHQTRRPRKLLLHRKEIKKLSGRVLLKGYSIIAIEIYFNDKNKVKVKIGLAKGKKLHDKRQSIKENEWKREKERMLRVK